jgi:plastocyanin
MKQSMKLSTKRMKLALVILGFIMSTALSFAQIKHSVAVSNNSFTPKNLTIEVGDTVEWTNNSGNHNVNGTTTTFSSNPESFGNDVGSNWTFKHVFKIAGTYNYQCDPHVSFGMTGIITVSGSSVTEEQSFNKLIEFYPNPTSDFLYFKVHDVEEQEAIFTVYNINGQSVLTKSLSISNESKLDVSELKKGNYLIQYFLNNLSYKYHFIKN